MAASSIVGFDPRGIDMVFAVSQENLNQGLSEYIAGLNSHVSWAFDVDNSGNLTPASDPENPGISFSGVLAPPPQPAQGAAPTWILDLSQSGSANQVTFNLTFEDGATFTDHQTNHTYTQSTASGGSLWVIPFQVNLSLKALEDVSNLPQWLRDKLAILNGQYGEVFDLSQVLLDLQTLASTVDPKSVLPKELPLYEWTMILQGTSDYIKTSAQDIFSTPPNVGYTLTQNSAPPTNPPPTYTPTAADFVIVPSSADFGGASALVFILMVQGGKFPAAPANLFTNINFFEDVKTTHGIALITCSKFLSFIQGAFNTTDIQTAISQYVQSVSTDSNLIWQIAASSDLATATNVTPIPTNTAFLTYSMPTQSSSASYRSAGAPTDTIYSTTNSTAAVSLTGQQPDIGYTTVTISGDISVQISEGYGGSGGGWDSPWFNWDWSLPYAIQSADTSDPNSGGGVQFIPIPSQGSWPSTATTTGNADASWNTVAPTNTEMLNGMLQNVFSSLQTTFKADFQALASLGDFVFPGGSTFTFQGPAVNDVFALYSKIQYQNPN